MKRTIIILTTALILSLSLTNCTMGGNELGLIGKWKGSHSTVINTPTGVIMGKSTWECEFKLDDSYILKKVHENLSDGTSSAYTETGKIVKNNKYYPITAITLRHENGKESTFSYGLSNNNNELHLTELPIMADGHTKIKLQKQ